MYLEGWSVSTALVHGIGHRGGRPANNGWPCEMRHDADAGGGKAEDHWRAPTIIDGSPSAFPVVEVSQWLPGRPCRIFFGGPSLPPGSNCASGRRCSPSSLLRLPCSSLIRGCLESVSGLHLLSFEAHLGAAAAAAAAITPMVSFGESGTLLIRTPMMRR